MNGRSRVMRWASTRHVIGTDILLPVGPSLITSAAQAVAAIVTTVAMLGVLAWTALLATGLVHLTPNPGWFGDVTAMFDAMDRVSVIGGYVVLLDLVCAAIIVAVHAHTAATLRATNS